MIKYASILATIEEQEKIRKLEIPKGNIQFVPRKKGKPLNNGDIVKINGVLFRVAGLTNEFAYYVSLRLDKLLGENKTNSEIRHLVLEGKNENL